MEIRKIGTLDVTAVGVGCNNFGRRIDAEAAAAVVNAALDAGINFFDTADVYGNGLSEEYLSRALGSRRRDVLIATKFRSKMEGQGEGAHPDYIKVAVEASLRRLNTDIIDLYQIHAPDETVPIADTLGALDDLVKAGKVREIGCSNFSAAQLREAAAAVKPGAARFVSVQNYYSMLHREPEAEVLPECARQGLAFLPYFPLESGLLTGKIRRGQEIPQGTRLSDSGTQTRFVNDQRLEIVEKLIAYAEERGHTLLDLAFSWLLAKAPVSSVIAGATKPEQIHANAAAAGWLLTETELKEVGALLA
jgi:aryl-alcohol dehydrogenase-like predicted oxidoreductase